MKKDHADVPVVMISGHGNIETAVAAIKRGAWMRLRFAISGHAAKPEVREPGAETKQAMPETIEPADTTINETKIEAATGN